MSTTDEEDMKILSNLVFEKKAEVLRGSYNRRSTQSRKWQYIYISCW